MFLLRRASLPRVPRCEAPSEMAAVLPRPPQPAGSGRRGRRRGCAQRVLLPKHPRGRRSAWLAVRVRPGENAPSRAAPHPVPSSVHCCLQDASSSSSSSSSSIVAFDYDFSPEEGGLTALLLSETEASWLFSSLSPSQVIPSGSSQSHARSRRERGRPV